MTTFSDATLRFPYPEALEPGDLIEIAPGLLWLRLALPYRLDHVNVFLIEDDGGWAVFDTGLGDERTRAAWEAVFAGRLAGARVTRVIVTHFHPDHVGLAGWLTARFEAPLYMTRTEYLFSVFQQYAPADFGTAAYPAFYRARGLSEEVTQLVTGRGHEYLRRTTGVPPVYTRLVAGESLRIGGREFAIFTGGGHAPEQAMLYCAAERLFLAADQVLARISPNVSVWALEPEADSLGIYLRSLAALRAALPGEALVLPCHNLPFYGLHERIDALIAHHAARCTEIEAACRTAPHSAGELVPVIFHRTLDAHQMGFAFGETLAHVNYMRREGRLAMAVEADGVQRLRAIER